MYQLEPHLSGHPILAPAAGARVGFRLLRIIVGARDAVPSALKDAIDAAAAAITIITRAVARSNLCIGASFPVTLFRQFGLLFEQSSAQLLFMLTRIKPTPGPPSRVLKNG